MIHDIFVQNGVHCDTCTHRGEMAEKLREGHYDLLTTDLKMQDASGYEVLETAPHVGHRQLAHHPRDGGDRSKVHH